MTDLMSTGPLTDDIVSLLIRDLEGMQRELMLFDDEAAIWRTMPGITNSAGSLAAHVAGNIQHFVGAVLGGTGYVRDRDAEFMREVSRAELTAALGAAIAAVREVLPRLGDRQLDAVYPDVSTATAVSTRRFLLHLCTHASFHVGQAGYLRRMLTGDARSTDTATSARLA
jgi:uncharacterized damage-inducible protein DinB